MTKSIWFQTATLEALNQQTSTMLSHIGIEFTAIGDDYLAATMPVDHRTRQPMGLLHGGASVALAETLGSSAAYLCIDSEAFNVVGLEINANHIRSVRRGIVTGIARPIHLGKGTQIWEIRITDDEGKLACISRLTVAVLAKNTAKST